MPANDMISPPMVPAALHVYPSGGHGYGLRNTGHTVNEWPFRVLSWLRDIGMIEK